MPAGFHKNKAVHMPGMISDVWNLGSQYDQSKNRPAQGSPNRNLMTEDINGPKVNTFGQKLEYVPKPVPAGQILSQPPNVMTKNQSQAFSHLNPDFDRLYEKHKENQNTYTKISPQQLLQKQNGMSQVQ